MIQAHQLSIDFGFGALLDEADLVLKPAERVCLVGRNGQGKTTLMKILAGQQTPDSGAVVFEPHTRIAYLPQTVPQDVQGTLLDVVLSGVDASAAVLQEYEQLSARLSDPPTSTELGRLQDLQEELDRRDGWSVRSDAEAALARLSLSPCLRFEDLSGGRKRQCLLIRALVSKPHLLMLDEPTNHLDIAAIHWLEDLLKGFSGSVLFVTHDRAFLRSVATRILDLDRGKLKSYSGDFDRYQERKQADLDAEAKAWSEFDKKLAKEEVWIRQGIKARRTRNEGRVRALKRLREERKQRRERVGSAKIVLQKAGRSGKRVIAAESLGYAWPDQSIVSDFNLELHSGDRLGIIGPNGCGKTTLLRLLLGELDPQSGVVHLGTKLEPIYFDQLRNQLDDDKTVHENLCDDSDTVFINGKPKHVISYLGDFLFSPERARSSVKVLSGGERNRLLLAKLFIHPANLLVLDEPTNDLDTETLELLETTLLDYTGSLIVVSHDREFLNNVVTSCVAFDADGSVRHYIGGYDDWLVQRPQVEAAPVEKSAKKQSKPAPKLNQPKLTFTQRHELERLPAQIEALESEQQELNSLIMSDGFYDQPHDDVQRTVDRLEALSNELLERYARWDELDALA